MTFSPLMLGLVLLGSEDFPAVFVRDEPVEVTAPDLEAGDEYGSAVRVTKERLFVGSRRDQENGVESGSVSVHLRSDFTREAHLVPADGADGDEFGSVLDADAVRVAVGAPFHAGGGAVYVYVFDGTDWLLEQKLVGANDLEFGRQLDLDGDRLVVGAPRSDSDRGSATVFRFDGTDWQVEQRLVGEVLGDEFGGSVALEGARLVVGEPGVLGSGGSGRVSAFEFDGASWNVAQQIEPRPAKEVGRAVAMEGNHLLVGAPRQQGDDGFLVGMVYAYVHDGVQWVEVQQIQPPTGERRQRFGADIRLERGLAIVGEQPRVSPATAYLFTLDGDRWVQTGRVPTAEDLHVDLRDDVLVLAQASLDTVFLYQLDGDDSVERRLGTERSVLTSGSGDFDWFGASIEIDGNTMLVGSPYLGSNGSVVAFERSGPDWRQTQTFAPNTPPGTERHAFTVDLDGDVALVSSTEAAFVFRRLSGVWTEEATLTRAQTDNDLFGGPVAIVGDRAMVAAPVDTNGSTPETGAVYFFDRVGGVWTERQRLAIAGIDANDWFGRSIAFDGDRLAVGAYGKWDAKVYVFEWDGAAYTHIQTLQASDHVGENTQFGWALDLYADTLLVSARIDRTRAYDSGSVYFYDWLGGSFGNERKLTPNDDVYDSFGWDVSLGDGIAVVGAPYTRIEGGSEASRGAVYVLREEQGVWSDMTRLVTRDTYERDEYDSLGSAVELDGARVYASNTSGLSGHVYGFDTGPRLDIDPLRADAGDTVEIRVGDGQPGGLVQVLVVEVDGVPVRFRLFLGRFDAQGELLLSTTVPPGLAGVEVTLEGMGWSVFGELVIAKRQSLQLLD